MSSIYKDINAAVGRDYRPVAALLIMVILGRMLRSVTAPWNLMASVGLGFGATLGATVLIFQKSAVSDLRLTPDSPIRPRAAWTTEPPVARRRRASTSPTAFSARPTP